MGSFLEKNLLLQFAGAGIQLVQRAAPAPNNDGYAGAYAGSWLCRHAVREGLIDKRIKRKNRTACLWKTKLNATLHMCKL